MITLLDIFGHLFNILYVVGSTFKRVIYFRGTLMVASAIEIYYYWNITDQPLWTDIIWSVVFIAVNVYWVMILFYENTTLKLDLAERKLFELTFNKMNPVQVKKLFKITKKETIEPDTELIKEGTHIDRLMLIISGIAVVKKGDKNVAYLREGSFLGEMSFLSGNPTSANVITLEETQIMVWDKKELKEFLGKNENIKKELNDVFSRDLIKKLVTD